MEFNPFNSTVEDVCKTATAKLEKIKKVNEDKANLAATEIAKQQKKKDTAETQISRADTAISNFKKLFGIEGDTEELAAFKESDVNDGGDTQN